MFGIAFKKLSYKIEDNESNGSFELQRYEEDKFTLKYVADLNQLAFKGRTYGGDGLYVADCRSCSPSEPYFDASNAAYVFTMMKDRFLWQHPLYGAYVNRHLHQVLNMRYLLITLLMFTAPLSWGERNSTLQPPLNA